MPYKRVRRRGLILKERNKGLILKECNKRE